MRMYTQSEDGLNNIPDNNSGENPVPANDKSNELNHLKNSEKEHLLKNKTFKFESDSGKHSLSIGQKFHLKNNEENLERNSRINIKFSDLTYSTSANKEKKILKGISGTFVSGQISAIFGPSGAGKSTLMDILAGYKNGKVQGDILVNEKPRCLKSFRKQICYVKQEEQLLEFLTVRESMEAAAVLKLGKSSQDPLIVSTIQEILSALGLEETKDTRVSNLSGGQRKRLTIAFELINKPPVLFFDEPTSGLDCQNSYRCIALLKNIAEEGRTVICTIHQPSSRLFEKFDYVYALADGNCIYRGSVSGIIPFLSALSLEYSQYANPAEFLTEVASGEYGDFITTIVQAVDNSLSLNGEKRIQIGKPIELDLASDSKDENLKGPTRKRGNEDVQSISKEETNFDFSPCHYPFISQKEDNFVHVSVSFWTQFCILFIRSFRSMIRDPIWALSRLVLQTIIGLVVGIFYLNIGNEAHEIIINIIFLCFCFLFISLTAVIPPVVTFPLETNVLIRERVNNWYSLKAYYLAKTLTDVPFQALLTVIFITIAYSLSNQPHEIERFAAFAGISIFNAIISQSFGLAIGAASNIQHSVFFVIHAIIAPLLFCGLFMPITSIPVCIRWCSYFSYLRYCFEGLFRAIYGLNRSPLPCSGTFCFIKDPATILKKFSIERDGLWFDFLMLFIYFILIRILGYFVLKAHLKRKTF